MVGRFIDHDGGQTNRPAVRFGNVSIAAGHVAGMPNSDENIEYYCLDMHSRTGFSGAPVFAYRTSGVDLRQQNSVHQWPWHPPALGLLGIHCSQFPEELKASDGKTISGLSGMTVALPSWHIADLISCPRFADRRAAVDAQWKGVNFPHPE